jgi:ABC-type glycerol-3-phosphate transport system substrate-binding protein
MKRTMAAILLCAAMAASLFAGGNREKSGGTAAPFKSGDSVYAGYDLAQPVKLYLYMLGDVPKAFDEILAKANAEYFQPILNTTLEVVFLAWSDYEVKYPLILSGGDDVDIIFTSSWCFYDQESAKGAFVEMTDDFISRWMPKVSKTQPPNSWLQVLTGGKIFAIPRMYAGTQDYTIAAVREDLRTKHRLAEPRDWESLQRYLFTIAEEERGIQAVAAAGENLGLQAVYLQTNGIELSTRPVWFAWKAEDRNDPRPENLIFLYMSDWYRDFALEMKDYAAKGVWSRNALNNTIQTTDAFAQGTSATVYWNDTVYTAGENMEKNGLGKAGYYDFSPGAPVRRSSYAGDCWAITTSSEHPDRAALLLDMMKTNTSLINLLMGGIPGRHYLPQGDGTYVPGPEASDYPFNGWCWALNYPDMLVQKFPEGSPVRLSSGYEERVWEPLIDAYRVDLNSIATEWAVISSLIEEYRRSFECGAFGDQTLDKIEEFRAKLKNAGADKLTYEFRSQYAVFLDKYK